MKKYLRLHGVCRWCCGCALLLLAMSSDLVPLMNSARHVAAANLPFLQAGEVTGSDEAQGDQFGSGVAVSSDGSTAVIGAPQNSSGRGAVYVFSHSSGAWIQQAKLTASDANFNDQLGMGVAINGDGTTFVAGAPGKSSNAGAAYVFTGSGATWTQQAELTASDSAASSGFGQAVAVSTDGNTTLIGSPLRDFESGAGYAFSRTGSVWTQQAEFLASDAATEDELGHNVAMSGDGNTVAIGAYLKGHGTDVGTGAVYLATRSGTTWSALTELKAADASCCSWYGWGITLSGDGGTLVVGANARSNSAGYVYVYTGGGTSWTQQGEFTDTGLYPNMRFGWSVAINTNGTVLAVGAPYDTASDPNSYSNGAIYIYDRSGSSWLRRNRLYANDTSANDAMSTAMAMSSDGTTIIAGAPHKGVSLNGAAYFFVLGTLNVTVNSSPVIAGTPPSVTVSVRDASNNLLTGYRNAVHFSSNDPKATYVGDYQFTPADGGTKTFTPVTFKTAGARTLTVTDTANASLTASIPVVVQPGPASTFTAPALATSAQAGVPLPFSLSALDAYGNTVTSYTGTAHLTSTDPLAVLPADAAFSVSDAGVKALSATFNTSGAPTVTITDTAQSSVTGTVTGITVSPRITSVSPASGSIQGGTAVTVTGAGLGSGMTITFGGQAATVSGVNNTAVVVVVPPHAAGQVAVTVTVNGQQASLPNGYTYGVVQSMPPPSSGGASGSSTPAPNPATSLGQRSNPPSGIYPPSPVPPSR